jgi:hypothetical protein
MRYMKQKDNVLHIRLDGKLLAALNVLAYRLGDDNTSSAARLAMRKGLQDMGIEVEPIKLAEPPTPEA